MYSLLLSTVSSEGTKERTDRVMLTPWVKFLWESHRNILELLKNNNNLQMVYRDVAKDAFKFCLSYERRTEFRKLCDIVSGIATCVVYSNWQPHTLFLILYSFVTTWYKPKSTRNRITLSSSTSQRLFSVSWTFGLSSWRVLSRWTCGRKPLKRSRKFITFLVSAERSPSLDCWKTSTASKPRCT